MKSFILMTFLLIGSSLLAQTTYNSNNPFFNPIPLGALGWNDNSNIDLNILQNNTRRMRLTSITWPGYNSANSIANASRIHLGINGNNQVPFSMLHLGYATPAALQRPWMNVGTTYGAGADIMYTGIIQSPGASNNAITIDAVVAWGCNDNLWFPSNGPDNLRFIFLAPTNQPISPGSAPEGLETMRITPWGNVGVGRNFNNNQQPFRRLVVNQRTDSAQFRIASALSPIEGLGQHAEFLSSPEGDLYIKPRSNGAARATAIGFLRGEESNPFHSPTASTRLDVNGLTRIRLLPDEAPGSLIMGYGIPGANNDIDDQFLGRIDFPTEDPECHVLNGEGEWLDICDGISGEDCRWKDFSSIVPGELDMYVGFDPTAACYRQNVNIGSQSGKAKLSVYARTERDRGDVGFESNITDSELGFEPSNNNYLVSAIKGISMGVNSDYGVSYIGVEATAAFGKYAVGVLANANGAAGINIVTYTKATTIGGSNIGLYTEAPSGSGNYAIQYIGAVTGSQPPITLSDESIKTGIETIENATQILSLLEPKQYFNIEPEERSLSLSEGQQYGFLAQEVQAVIPSIVKPFSVAAKIDSNGFVNESEMELLGIQYQSIIPILVAGFNEQNGTVGEQATLIANQNETIAALEAQLDTQADQLEEMQNNMQSVLDAVQQMQQKTSNCCTQKTESSNTGAVIIEDLKPLELEQNVPNPFDDQTRIAFNLPNDAQVILEITDAAGRPLERLIDGQMSSGEHTTLWDGSNMASGIYFYTLYADGELITKKMIKK